MYTIVKDYVRLRHLSQREMFVPLAHPPGDAQADFGEAMVVIRGVERKAHYLVVDLPQSDDCFVMAFPVGTDASLAVHLHPQRKIEPDKLLLSLRCRVDGDRNWLNWGRLG